MKRPATILVVDDHEPNLFGLRDLLQRSEYNVCTTTSGREAIDIAKEQLPDAVLLDVVMPDLSGLDVCVQLKQHQATRLIPIVLMSGAHQRDARLAGMAAGADDFLAKPIDTEELSARIQSLVRMKRLTDELESAEALFLTLGRIIEARDPRTEGHCERLARYATELGASLHLEQSDLDALYRGGFLHDIGKIAIPDRVLLKKSRLTAGEYELMKCHPAIGDDLCRTVRSFDAVRPIVRHHHERLDGTGYPDGLAGDQIPVLAQIVTVADVFDALTTERPYRKAMSKTAAFTLMRQEAHEGAYSMDLVQRLAELRGEHPERQRYAESRSSAETHTRSSRKTGGRAAQGGGPTRTSRAAAGQRAVRSALDRRRTPHTLQTASSPCTRTGRSR
jgi:putative two-component system response regulator